MSKNRRRHSRIKVPLPVELTHESIGTVKVRTLDMSKEGLFLIVEGEKPPVGSLVTVKMSGKLAGDEEPPTVTMRVVRITDRGIGLETVSEQ